MFDKIIVSPLLSLRHRNYLTIATRRQAYDQFAAELSAVLLTLRIACLPSQNQGEPMSNVNEKMAREANDQDGTNSAPAKLPKDADASIQSDNTSFSLVPLSSLPQVAIRWRWPKRIPRGMVTVIAGYQKAGKSLVVSSIAATITRGGKFPAGEGKAKRGHVIIINNEDDPQQILGPRIAAAGGDLKRVHVMKGGPNLSVANLVEKLEPEIEKLKYLRAVILDPITGVVALNRNSADHVRGVLAALGTLAARHNIAIIVVVHLNKSKGARAISRVSGSFEWTAASRAAFLVVDQVGTNRHMFLPMANNIGLEPKGLVFHIKEVKVAGGLRAPTVMWEKDPIIISADDALAAASERVSDPSPVDEATDFVRKAIDGQEWIRANELFELADEHGFQRKVVRKAAARLGYRARKKGWGPSGYWIYKTTDPDFKDRLHMSEREPADKSYYDE
jgi:putative DNA primase/helicase